MHIIPFKGKNLSGTYDLNLLFNNDDVYIMDNHLAASWCWLQKINLKSKYNLLHIDRHYDVMNSHIDVWLKELKNQNIQLPNITIDRLTSLTYHLQDRPTNDKFPLFRWDNYLTIFYRLYPNLIDTNMFATHKDGDKISEIKFNEIDAWELQESLSYWLNKTNKLKWIVNIDIDYFFTNYHNDEDYYMQLYSNDFVIRIAEEISKSTDNIEVLTIALSPEMCGGWKESEKVAKLITDHLSIKWPIY